jgi:hypothetical protein
MVLSSVALVCTGFQFKHGMNILHRVGYQMDIRNVSVRCILLFKNAIPVQY